MMVQVPSVGTKRTNRKSRITLFDRITVSAHFREEVAKAFPALGDNLAYWRMMNYLLFGACDDRETGKRLLAHEFLADIAGHKANISNFRSWQFLERFRADVFGSDALQWTRHKPKKKCRQVETLILPATIAQALEDEYANKHYETGRVFFSTGEKFTRTRQREQRKQQQDQALANAIEAGSEEAREILDYLNNLKPHLFYRAYRKNHEAAEQAARLLPKAKARRQQLEILKHIAAQPQPFYQPSKKGHTDRVFGTTGSLPLLAREVRRAWTKGWHKADLRSAQLAINATFWSVPDLTAFLRNKNKTIWQELTDHFHLGSKEAATAKGPLKTALYSLCYGMDVRKIAKNLTNDFVEVGIQRTGSYLWKHPLMRSLQAARTRMTKKISKAQGAHTCFGKWLGTETLRPNQILALQSQAIELKLMHPLFTMAKTTSDLTITLFLHDGIAVHFTDKSRITSWQRRMNDEVKQVATTFNIETDLEWEA
jgi:hypothetical protein